MKRLTCCLLLFVGLCAAAPAQTAPAIPAGQIDAVLEQSHPLILDVRSAAEVTESGTLPGAVHIPLDELERRLDEIPKTRPVLTACQGGKRAARAAELLLERGYQVVGSCGLRDYAGEREPRP